MSVGPAALAGPLFFDKVRSRTGAYRKGVTMVRLFARTLLALVALWVSTAVADPPSGIDLTDPKYKDHSNPWLLTWIPAVCCVTNDCCFEIKERDLEPLPDYHWKIKATGQVRKQRDFSPDGKYYLCACNYVQMGDKSRHVQSLSGHFYCLFAARRSAQLPRRP